ncbi:hypothetical protein G6F56_012425 [Rhizopus delemar]|nr:hypothetical protein G6F56_012425 [Rhizopus delemar]
MAERPIEFEEDEESEPEVDLMETTQQELEESKDVRMEEATKPEAQSTEIPSEPTITNKPLNAIQQEQTEEEEKLSHTPKLDDISDEEPEQTLDNDDDDNDVDNMNDPSKHPAIAHAEAHMTDDDLLTDSAAATPSFTENDTPMPNSLDEIMEKSENKDIPPSPTTN